jgi:hypothetical protein
VGREILSSGLCTKRGLTVKVFNSSYGRSRGMGDKGLSGMGRWAVFYLNSLMCGGEI